MKSFFLYIYMVLKGILRSKFRILFLLFFLLLYRIEFMADIGFGIAKILQAGSLILIVYLLNTFCPNVFGISLKSTNSAIRSCIILYLFAILSTVWAFNPTFAFFLSFQNVVLILLFVWFFALFDDFYSTERAFITVLVLLQLFQFICLKFNTPNLFVHFLPGASVAAMTLTYSLGEFLNMKYKNGWRSRMFIYAVIISCVSLVLYTSGGANASAVCGVAVAMFFSGKKVYALLLLFIGAFIFFNQELIDDILLTLMPGKDMKTIQIGNGRDAIWAAIIDSVSSRPLYGWGFACAERTVPHVIGGQILSDSHNSYIGIYGSLGYIGCILFGVHLFQTGWSLFSRINHIGYVGLLSAFSCACLNMYTYGFLSGKACSITMVYFMIVSLSYHYNRFNRC